MRIRPLRLFVTLAILTFGPGCPMQQPAMDGTDNGQSGGNDNGDGQIGAEGVIGFLNAADFRSISTGSEQNSVVAGAVFNTIEDSEGDDANVKTVGDCVVTTVRAGDIDFSTPDVEPLDAGPMGTLGRGGRRGETLSRQSEGVYSGPTDLADRGFGAGQTLVFEFPGGTDVAAFMASIDLPGALTVSSPDLTAADLMIDTGAALPIVWTASGTADRVNVTVSTSDASGTVTISCTFDDTGSATVPQAAMECLSQNPLTITASVNLANTASVEVDLVAGGMGTVQATAQTGITRVLFAGSSFDPCQFIDCPEGQTCNPLTFVCE